MFGVYSMEWSACHVWYVLQWSGVLVTYHVVNKLLTAVLRYETTNIIVFGRYTTTTSVDDAMTN